MGFVRLIYSPRAAFVSSGENSSMKAIKTTATRQNTIISPIKPRSFKTNHLL